MTKRIYLEPTWKMHTMYKENLIPYPPQGYEFITSQTNSERVFKFLAKSMLSYRLYYQLCEVVPLGLIKSYLDKFKKIPKADLTYSCGHLIFRKEPWVIDLEYIAIPLSHGKFLKKYKKLLERTFASEYCKKILCYYEIAKKTLLLNLDCSKFEHKIEVVPRAVRRKNFIKQFNSDKIKLLFVGSANIKGEFEIKGGAELIDTFINLNRKYPNLELVIRSDMPQYMKAKLRRFSNVKIIEEVIPWHQLEQEFKTADIFLLPAHNTPWVAFLDAMSYELPVVTIDTWANSEIIEEGKTGFLVHSDKLRYKENFLPDFDSPSFRKALKMSDPEVVKKLVEKVSILIENEKLRRMMGRAARWEVEYGKFSIQNRNKVLKRIFDEITI